MKHIFYMTILIWGMVATSQSIPPLPQDTTVKWEALPRSLNSDGILTNDTDVAIEELVKQTDFVNCGWGRFGMFGKIDGIYITHDIPYFLGALLSSWSYRRTDGHHAVFFANDFNEIEVDLSSNTPMVITSLKIWFIQIVDVVTGPSDNARIVKKWTTHDYYECLPKSYTSIQTPNQKCNGITDPNQLDDCYAQSQKM